MGNLLSVLIGCVGAVELITLLHQITTRAELEYERLRLSESGSEYIVQEHADSLESISTAPVPQIHFEEYERSSSVPESSAPVVDGLKTRPLVRDDGTGRRRAFKKRDSSGSLDSKLSREEELKMFTSLEEEEFRSMTQGDYVPISYNSESGLKVKKHHKRHRKSPTISDALRESTGTLSSSELTEETLSEGTEDEVSYPWGDINPEHHKGLRQQMQKTHSIGDLNEEDEKLASSAESGADWRKNAERATKIAETDASADVTVSSAEWKNSGEFEAVPTSFACVEQDEQIPELEDEAKVEEWLSQGRLRDSFSPTATLTRSKRCLQMDSMDVQDGDSESEGAVELTPEDLDIVIVEATPILNHFDEAKDENSEETYSYLDLSADEKEEILMELSHKSSSPVEVSREFLEHERQAEVEEESVVSGEEEIEDFDDIVNALKKNVAKEEIQFEDLVEDASPTSEKSDIFTLSPEKEKAKDEAKHEGECSDDDDEEEESLKFPAKSFAAYNEFPTEDNIPPSETSGGSKSRCEILEAVRRENRRRQRNGGPDRYYAPRPSVIDFPTRLQQSNAALEEQLKLIFSGEYTKAMSKDWHTTHFCCWQCDESLTGQRYVLRDDHPYCIKCYENVFANTCESCNKIIGIDSKDLSYKDKHWHEACFLCNKCRISLVDKQFGSKADRIYCGNCYDQQFASRCDGCGEIFRAGTKKMEYKTRQWHEKCFCCCVCKTPIGTKSFIPREQEIYCAGCYEEKYATRCIKCNKIITSGGVTYKNEPWHRECFTCTHCSTSLAGQRFTSRDDKPYCADCFGELFAKRCTACTKPITGIGGTRFISFEDRHWHNDCFICALCKTSLVGRGFITDGADIICPECAKQKLI
ncbi:uncharacterized protein LOC132261177 isoform X1 [Phlebotomus argentipes]|nr:uncharacterized protein LOC132261177 isoform X1 [Phlebotomus argentipes]